MSLNLQPNCENDCQLLNYNMENISHELCSLLIGGELDNLGAIGRIPTTKNGIVTATTDYRECCVTQLNNNSMLNNSTNSSYVASAPNFGNPPALGAQEAEMLQLYRQYYYQQQLQNQQLLEQQQQQQKILQQRPINAIPNLYAAGPTPSAIAATHLKSAITHGLNNNYVSTAPLLKQAQYDGRPSACGGTGGVSSRLSSPPKFEFHFLRYQSNSQMHPDTNNVPLISSAARSEYETEHYFGSGRRGNRDGCNNFGGNGGQRRYMKQPVYAKEDEIDYDKIVVDLSVLGLSLDNKEHNPVLRLFGLLRKMHYYLDDVLPASGAAEEIDFTACYGQTNTTAKCSMPCTMNVQYQVRQAARKCTIFLIDMQRILNANKMFSLELYTECEQSLNMLRKLLTQFEAYKRVEMEHKRGQFVTDEARANTQQLEQLVTQLSDQIRESHIYVHVFNWAVERSKRSTVSDGAKEEQAMTPRANEWVAKAAAGVATALTNAATMATDIKGEGIVAQSVTYNESSNSCGVGVVTVVDNEPDADRQSQRYIGYK